MLLKRQLILVVGAGGSRKDFVAGWLGKLQQFDDTRWIMDLRTGCSNDINEFKLLDRAQTVTDIIQQIGCDLDPTAERFLTGTCHGFRWDQAGTEPYVTNGSLHPFYIDISTADVETVHWEYIVKTWLTNRRWPNSVGRPVWDIDTHIGKSDVTDLDRISAVTKLIKTYNSATQPVVNVTKLDYSKLFCAGGSHYLCEQMKINATVQEHKFWDAMLPFCQSPDEIICWGQVWRKQDYFNRFMCSATKAA